MIYKVWLYLEAEYDDIKADCEEEAFEIARERVIEEDSWWYEIEEQPVDVERNE